MKKFKEILNKLNVQSVIVAVSLIVIGLLFVIFPSSSARIICYVAGAILLVWGIFKLAVYFASGLRDTGSYTLAQGAALIAVALLLFVKPDLIAELLTVLFGIILIVNGVVWLQRTIGMAKMKAGGWWILLIIALATLVLGLVITFDPFSSKNALMIFAGISMIVIGVLDIVASAYCNAKIEKQKRHDDPNIIDV